MSFQETAKEIFALAKKYNLSPGKSGFFPWPQCRPLKGADVLAICFNYFKMAKSPVRYSLSIASNFGQLKLIRDTVSIQDPIAYDCYSILAKVIGEKTLQDFFSVLPAANLLLSFMSEESPIKFERFKTMMAAGLARYQQQTLFASRVAEGISFLAEARRFAGKGQFVIPALTSAAIEEKNAPVRFTARL